MKGGYFSECRIFCMFAGDIDDDEEILDWLTDPENMELTDHI
jgi:hypothetical protein